MLLVERGAQAARNIKPLKTREATSRITINETARAFLSRGTRMKSEVTCILKE